MNQALRDRPSPTVVVALGGNALAPDATHSSIADQFRHARTSMAPLVAFAKDGWRIAIVHGNGPQVGDELVRQEMARHRAPPLPLGVLVAGTAGWIGYMLQQSLENGLARQGIKREVITLVTQTLVDPRDPLLDDPSKPIGHELREEDVEDLRRHGIAVGRDGAGEWRRLAPSPKPIGVVEAALVRRLVAAGVIVIAAGGGGPAVYRSEELGYEGLDVVVDKDRVAMVLAIELAADVLMFLTDVAGVYRGWGTPGAELIPRLAVDEAAAMVADGSLGRGGMGPKVEAAVGFVRARAGDGGGGGGGRAVIASLDEGPAALRGESGTTIAREP